MTKPTTISSRNSHDSRDSRDAQTNASLIERVSATYGLDALKSAPPPKSLPKLLLREEASDRAGPEMGTGTGRETGKRAAQMQAGAQAPGQSGAQALRQAPEQSPEQSLVQAPEQTSGQIPDQIFAQTPEQALVQPAPPAQPPGAAAPASNAAEPARHTHTPGYNSGRPVVFGGKIQPIDRAHLRDQGMITLDSSATGLFEEFRIVKRQVLNDARRLGTAEARRILVCSPHSGEGKTYCAVNLALALAAERDIEVLLVDVDFAMPSILSTFGIEANMGFMDALSDSSLQPEELVVRTDIKGLHILPSGNRTNSDTEYLASQRTSDVLARLTDNAPDRILIFDTPPTLSASPAAELAKHVGQTLLVTRADSTGRNALEDAFQLLSSCPQIKLLLNGARFSPSGRNFGSYGDYGE